MYHVYMLSCTDGSLYTGITVDLTRRVEEHNTSSLGAKYTRGRRPVKLVYAAKFPSRSEAAKAEWRLKKMSRREKLGVISGKKRKSP